MKLTETGESRTIAKDEETAVFFLCTGDYRIKGYHRERTVAALEGLGFKVNRLGG